MKTASSAHELRPGAAADGAVAAGGSRRSAAQGLRALGRFADAGWQDSRAVRDSRGPCSEKGPFPARSSRGVFPKGDLRGFSDTQRAYLAKASSFWIHGGDMLPRTGDFPVRGPFWDAWSEIIATNCRPGTHQGEILPRQDPQERTAREYCHGKAPGSAQRRRPASCLRAASWCGAKAVLLVAPGTAMRLVASAPQCRTLPPMRTSGRYNVQGRFGYDCSWLSSGASGWWAILR